MQEQELDTLEQEDPKPKPKLPGMEKSGKPPLPGLGSEKKNPLTTGGGVSKTGGTVGSSSPQSGVSTNPQENNPFAIGGQYNKQQNPDFDNLDLSNTRHDAAIAEQIKTPLKRIPSTPILDQTAIRKPISEVDVNEGIARQKQHKIDMETAIDNTTLKVLKNKGIVAGKGSPYYEAERKKIEEKTKPTMIGGIVINGAEATYHKDKDGNIGLDRNLGFLEDIRTSYNNAVNAEDEAKAYNGMTTEQKVQYANQKMQENPNPEYMSERSGVGGLVGGSIPYLTRAAFAGATAAALAAAAPETGGASLVGLAPTLTVLFTAPDFIEQGKKDEQLTRFYQLKQENPNADENKLMKIAEQGGISGGIVGAAEALAFTTTLKLPILKDSKDVLTTYLKGVASSAVHLGGIMAGTTAVKIAERKIEGYNVKTDEAIDEITTAFTENATAGAILNGLISGANTLPKVLKSVYKKIIVDNAPISEIKTALQANVEAGRIPPEVAEQTIADIEGYKVALAKTADGLKPETQASVAGLIQARDNVAAEMATKDPTQRAVYEQKIEAYNKQIEKITETNDPLKYEVDEVTGNTIDKVVPKVEDTKLSEPLEGRDEQGIPIGKDVPPPTETKKVEPEPNVVENSYDRQEERSKVFQAKSDKDYLKIADEYGIEIKKPGFFYKLSDGQKEYIENESVKKIDEKYIKESTKKEPNVVGDVQKGVVTVPVKIDGKEIDAKYLDEYKGHKVVEIDGDVYTYDPKSEVLFKVALDDSKATGSKKVIPEANNVETAKQYIDWKESANKENKFVPIPVGDVVVDKSAKDDYIISENILKTGEDAVFDAADNGYKKVGDLVDGRTVREDIPNMGSIEASLYDYKILSGVREIPMSEFGDTGTPKKKSKLAEEIEESGEINPLIVVIDKDGPYILEGGHRFDALKELGAKSFPAKIVIDTQSINEAKSEQSLSQPQPSNVVEGKGSGVGGDVYYHGTGDVKAVTKAISEGTFKPMKIAGVEIGINIAKDKSLASKYAEQIGGESSGVVEMQFSRTPKIKKYSSAESSYDARTELSTNPKEGVELWKKKLLSEGYDGYSTPDVTVIFSEKGDILKPTQEGKVEQPIKQEVVEAKVESKPTQISKTKEKFKIATPDGTKDVVGQKVSLSGYEGLDLFVHREKTDSGRDGDFVLTEKRTGLQLGKGETVNNAAKNGLDILEWQQAYNKEYPSIYEQVNGHIDKKGTLDGSKGYDNLSIPKITTEQKIKILEDKIAEQEAEIVDEKKKASRFFSTANTEFQQNFIKKIQGRIKELKNETNTKEQTKQEVEQPIKPEIKNEEANEVQQPSKVNSPMDVKPDKTGSETGEGKETGENKGITQAANEVRRQETGLPEFERNPESFEQWRGEAEKLIKNGYDVEKLMDRLQKTTDTPTPVENAIRKIYYATIDAEVAKNPTDKLLSIQKRNAQVGDLANRRLGQGLVSLKGEEKPLSSISDFYVAKMEAAGVETLTDAQKAEVKKQYDHVQKTNEEATLKIQKLEEENARLRAEAEVRKARTTTKKDKKDFAKEREDIKKSILDKWNKSKNVGFTPDPSKDLLMDIAPDVAKLVKSYIQEGVVKLEELVRKVHEELKGYIPSITEKNVNDIIAGQYDKPRETKGDLLAKLRGIKDKKSEEAVKILARIKAGDFDAPKKQLSWVDNPEIKKNFPKEYNAALDAIKAKEDARHEFDIALLRDQMARRTLGEKATDNLSKAAGTVKAITTGIDDSAVAIQTYVSMLVRPRTGVKAFYQHIRQGFSQKKFDRWLSALHNSPDFKEMREMGLDVTEPASLKEREKEEIFNNRFSGTIKIKGKEYKLLDAPLKPFERAFTTLGNVTRVVGYRTISEKYKREGYTPEKDPELFKSLAKRLNTETGRGQVNEYVDMANKVVTMGIWSPKLMAQKFNILGISDLASIVLSKSGTKGYYRQLHPKERIAAIKDVAQFATTIMALSYVFALANGGNVDDDPLSSTFMDVKLPNGKSYNFTGGFSGYIRAISQFVAGKKHKDGESKKVGRLETAGRFFRGKTPPVTSGILDLSSGKNFMGQPTSVGQEVVDLAPISLKGIAGQIQNDGATSFFTQGIPTFFGFNVKNEKDYQKANSWTPEDLKKPSLKALSDAGAVKPDYDPEKIKTKYINGKPTEKLSDKTKKVQDDYIKKHTENYKLEADKLVNGFYKVYKNTDGGVHIKGKNTNEKGMTYTPFKDLTADQKKYLEGQITRRATVKTKKALKLELADDEKIDNQ